MLDRARRSTDEAERKRLYREAEDIVVQEAPWATSYTYSYLELWQPYLHGYRPHPVLSQHVRHAWIDGGQKKVAARGCSRGLRALDRFTCPERGAGRSTLALAGGPR